MTPWPHQIYAFSESTKFIDLGEKRICVTSPTGGGKTFIMTMLMEWAGHRDWQTVLYTNRKMLLEQTSDVVFGAGIAHGVRAASYDDQRERRVQVSSTMTEASRVYRKKRWDLHKANLVIIDEGHLQKGQTMERIISDHEADGAAIVGFTATPLDIGHLYTKLIVAGNLSELRKCGALVPCHHYGPDEPDMRNFKAKTKTGEYTENEVRKAIMTPTIFGRVYDEWKRLNKDARPAILFAPGVDESVWFCEQFAKKGVRCGHIDGKHCWLDGERQPTSQELRDFILKESHDGKLAIISNRFVLREGIDAPWLYHGIFATVYGSLQSYLQSGGRLLRSHPSLNHVVLQDHGGNWHRHGSLNADRHWELNLTANIASGLREEKMRDKREPEPICCPKCKKVRQSGPVCPECGFASQRRSRMVVQSDGRLKEYVGDIYKPRQIAVRPDTSHKWTQMYYRAKNSRNEMTFRQAEGFFFYENHYYPPRDLPLMPTTEMDWFRKVKDVPRDRLS